MDVQTPNGLKIYTMAKDCLGLNLCENRAYGCAETVNAIVEAATGTPVGGGASTFLMYKCLLSTGKFTAITNPLPGDIIISPTGLGTNPQMPNGHVGIVAMYGILSNDSLDGLLEEKYTLDTWNARYKVTGGYPVLFFRAN